MKKLTITVSVGIAVLGIILVAQQRQVPTEQVQHAQPQSKSQAQSVTYRRNPDGSLTVEGGRPGQLGQLPIEQLSRLVS